MPRLEGWVTELNDVSATRTTARRVIADVEALGALTGIQLAESWYVRMLANSVLEDTPGTCAAAREVKRLHTDRSRLSTADLALSGCQ